MHENAEILPADRRRPELILGRPGGDDGRLLRRGEGFPGEMAQAAPALRISVHGEDSDGGSLEEGALLGRVSATGTSLVGR